MSLEALAPTRRRARPVLRVATIVLGLLLVVALVSLVWTPYPVDSLDVSGALGDVSAAHWLGTDQLGRDLLSLLMKATLTSFVVSAVGLAIGLIVGLPLGYAAATWGRFARSTSLRLGGFAATFPALVAAVLFTVAFGPGTSGIMLAIGLGNIGVFAGAAHDGLVAERAHDYVDAARLAGMGRLDIFRRHVLPGILQVIGAQAAFQLAAGVMIEASLAYVGLGAQPPAISLGLMLRDAQPFAMLKPWIAIAPGLVLVVIVLLLNAVGNVLTEQHDRRQARGEAVP